MKRFIKWPKENARFGVICALGKKPCKVIKQEFVWLMIKEE